MTTKTTAKDFKLFKETAQKWLKYFGINGWNYSFEHTESPELQLLGWCKVAENCDGLPDRRAVLGLEINWGEDEVTPEEIKRIAFHESCELLFARIEALACERFLSRRELREEVHALIHTFENTVFRDVG